MPKDLPKDEAEMEGAMKTVEEMAAKLAADPDARIPPLDADPNLHRKVLSVCAHVAFKTRGHAMHASAGSVCPARAAARVGLVRAARRRSPILRQDNESDGPDSNPDTDGVRPVPAMLPGIHPSFGQMPIRW